MRSLPIHARRGQLFLPMGMIATRALDYGGPCLPSAVRPELKTLLADLRHDRAPASRRSRARHRRPCPPVKAAFLPLALVRPYLDRMDRPDYEPLSGAVELPPWRRQMGSFGARAADVAAYSAASTAGLPAAVRDR